MKSEDIAANSLKRGSVHYDICNRISPNEPLIKMLWMDKV